MENPLSNYLDKDLLKSVQSFTIKQGTSKDGNVYYYLCLTLINGYQARIFPNSDAVFAYCNAFDTLDITKQFESDF